MEEQVKKKKSKGRKVLKGILIAFGCLFGILVLLVAFSPLILETYINSESGNRKVNEIAGDYLNAKFDLGKINIKVWKNMPNVELELINSEIISKAIKDDLTDTLIKFDTLRLSVNIIEFLKNDSIIVNEAFLSHPIVNGYVTAEGKANWEIYESDTTPDEDTSSFDYKIRINRLLIDDLQASYIDEESQMSATLDSTNLELTGEINAEIIDIATNLKLKATYDDGSSQILAKVEPTTINLDGKLNDGDYKLSTSFGLLSAEFSDSTSRTTINLDTTGITAHAIITDTSYDLDTKVNLLLSEYNDSSLTFSEIPLNLDLKAKANSDLTDYYIDTLSLTSNDIFVGASGMAKSLADSSWNTDLALVLDVPQIDNVLEMIPKSLVADLKKYKISGSVNFNGTAKGTYKDDIYPNIDANLVLNDIRAVVLEQNAEVKLNMESNLKYNAEKVAESYIDVKRLNATVGETYFNLKGKASNILGDPYINAKLKCNLNLDYISSLFPIDDLTYKGKLSSDIEARFSLANLMKMNVQKIYMLGNINIERILLRIPSMRFLVFGQNATADLGINSMKSRRSERLQLSSARVTVDTVRVSSPRTIEARVSKLNLYANVEEPINEVPHLIVAGSLRGMEAIVADTMFVSGKTGRISMAIRPDTTDALIPALRASLGLDSIVYYEPTQGAFLDSTRIVLNGRPRVRRFTRVNGERVEIDPSTRKPINTDSLINLCTSIEDAEGALRKFRFDGKIYAKAARYMSPYFDLKTGTRRLDVTFTDDTLHLNNFMLRVGRSLMKVDGRVDNMRRAFLRGRTLSADLNIKSRNLDLNEILYANYMGEQAKLKDDEAKKSIQERLAKAKAGMGNAPQRPRPNITDSARAHYVDSIRKAYSKKDLSEIYNERMGKMKEMMDRAHKEELAANDDNEIQDTAEQEYDTVPMTLIEVPANLNGKINLKLDTVKFAGLKMNDLNGDITVQNSTLSIKDMKTSSNVGDLKLNAIYTCNNPDTAKAGLDLIGTNITVEDLLTAFPMIDSILPMLSSFEGKLDCELSAITDLDKEMEPILPTLQTACHINGKNLVLLDGETFTTVAKYLMFKKKTKNVIDNMSVEFTIDKNMLSVYPFTLSMDKYKVAVSGRMDFDFKYFFHISVLEPKALPNLGINVQTKEPKKNKKDKGKDEEEEGELAEETDDFQFRLVKPLYKDEKSIAQSINLVNKSGLGRISLQQNLRKTIQNIIENYDTNKEQ
ncbi:MAG: hypothetical protein J5709_10675 [Bacteroidales bacterium]|nr:hypothetical protein [Bacteroidales bacterium]